MVYHSLYRKIFRFYASRALSVLVHVDVNDENCAVVKDMGLQEVLLFDIKFIDARNNQVNHQIHNIFESKILWCKQTEKRSNNTIKWRKIIY